MITTDRPFAPFARLGAAILTLAALLVAMVLTSPPASAHARLEASSPKDGSTLTATPPEVMLRFNEPIKEGLDEITVKAGSTDATDGDLEIEGNTLYQPLKSTLEAGDYTVTYKVVSADGHPVSGSLSFTYDPPEGDTGADEPTGSESESESATSSTSSGSATPPPASSSTTGTSEPGTTSSTSAPESSSTSATDGETEPAAPEESSTSSDDAAEDASDEATDEGGVPAWAWIAGIGALAIILAGIGLLVRGRRDPGNEEDDVQLDEWQG